MSYTNFKPFRLNSWPSLVGTSWTAALWSSSITTPGWAWMCWRSCRFQSECPKTAHASRQSSAAEAETGFVSFFCPTGARLSREPAEPEEPLPGSASEFIPRSSGRSACLSTPFLRFRGRVWRQWFSRSSVWVFTTLSGARFNCLFCLLLIQTLNNLLWVHFFSGFLIWTVQRRDLFWRH